MTYEEYVLYTFREDQSAMGMDSEEIEDIIEEYPFKQLEKWLLKRYDLKDMYENDCC